MASRRSSVKDKFGYKIGTLLGGATVILFLISAVMMIVASMAAIHVMAGLSGWILWLGTIAVCLFILWLLPLGWDLIVLAPLAIWGAYKSWGLPWIPATILFATPAILVLILSRLQKDD